jgi:hypothetical protein
MLIDLLVYSSKNNAMRMTQIRHSGPRKCHRVRSSGASKNEPGTNGHFFEFLHLAKATGCLEMIYSSLLLEALAVNRLDECLIPIDDDYAGQ